MSLENRAKKEKIATLIIICLITSLVPIIASTIYLSITNQPLESLMITLVSFTVGKTLTEYNEPPIILTILLQISGILFLGFFVSLILLGSDFLASKKIAKIFFKKEFEKIVNDDDFGEK